MIIVLTNLPTKKTKDKHEIRNEILERNVSEHMKVSRAAKCGNEMILTYEMIIAQTNLHKKLLQEYMNIELKVVTLAQYCSELTFTKHTSLNWAVKCSDGKRLGKKVAAIVGSLTLLNTQN